MSVRRCSAGKELGGRALETRMPFLDHRAAELAARIPLRLKVGGRQGKQIVRKPLYGLVPREILDRPKAGFGVPVGEWMKGPLRPWAEDLLDPDLIGGQGWFDSRIVSRRWQQHLSGHRDSTPALWAILTFQSWLQSQQALADAPIARLAS